mmetsp:Transcript_26805/g.44016  ORF Transcript_26805/g.44016 Transcript_26805/m.44016 type:complete len:234 (+) Transcript_26805:128-829(+)
MDNHYAFPTNALGFVEVANPLQDACTNAVAQARSDIYPINSEEDRNEHAPRFVYAGAILGRKSKSDSSNFVDLGIDAETVGISRDHLGVKSITPNSSEEPTSMVIGVMDGASNCVRINRTRGGERSDDFYPPGAEEHLLIGDAISFYSLQMRHFCLVGLVMPYFDVKQFIEPDLKMLPHIVHWFDEARINMSNPIIDSLKLSAIYQFTRAEPMSIVSDPTKRRSKRVRAQIWK